MAIYAESQPTTTRLPAPAGNHFARCVSMIDLGHHSDSFDGKDKRVHKCRFTFELPNELHTFSEEGGPEPYLVSREFNLSLHEKASLRAFLQSWRGKPFTEAQASKFDVSVLIGIPCMLNIIHVPSKDGTRTYANISSVAPVAKGMADVPQITPSFEFSLGEFDAAKLETLPDFLKEKIKPSEEYMALQQPSVTQADGASAGMDNDLPF